MNYWSKYDQPTTFSQKSRFHMEFVTFKICIPKILKFEYPNTYNSLKYALENDFSPDSIPRN